MTTPIPASTPPRDSQGAAASARRFGTILAVSRGEVYVRSTACPESGWMLRARAAVTQPAARALPTAA
jgi:hypothetical protein